MKTDQKEGPAESPPEVEGPRSFSRFLASISDGEAESMLSYHLQQIGQRLQEERKAQGRKVAGELKLTVKLGADVNGTVTVVYAIDVKVPKSLVTPALFWLTRDGNLSERDTRQLELRPREIPAAKREIREAPAAPQSREI